MLIGQMAMHIGPCRAFCANPQLVASAATKVGRGLTGFSTTANKEFIPICPRCHVPVPKRSFQKPYPDTLFRLRDHVLGALAGCGALTRPDWFRSGCAMVKYKIGRGKFMIGFAEGSAYSQYARA
jgi:hypothetical protein